MASPPEAQTTFEPHWKSRSLLRRTMENEDVPKAGVWAPHER